MRTTAREDLERELQDPEFRKLYGAAEAKSELAVAIADARHSLGLTQEEMARKVRVSQPYIAKLESGDANPTIGALGTILAILHLRLTMGITPLLPRPSPVSSADTFGFSFTVEYKLAADASGAFVPAAPVATAAQIGKGQQVALFPTENYNPFRLLAKVDDLSPVAVTSRSFEEASVGGQRTWICHQK